MNRPSYKAGEANSEATMTQEEFREELSRHRYHEKNERRKSSMIGIAVWVVVAVGLIVTLRLVLPDAFGPKGVGPRPGDAGYVP